MCLPICKTEGDDLCAHENPSSAIEISPANESDIKYAVMLDSRASMIRHARPRAGHPRLADAPKAWMAGTSPANVPESKSPRPVRRGLSSCDLEYMQVICPTCQIFSKALVATQGVHALNRVEGKQ
jgi:hypothetical protein